MSKEDRRAGGLRDIKFYKALKPQVQIGEIILRLRDIKFYKALKLHQGSGTFHLCLRDIKFYKALKLCGLDIHYGDV